MKLESVFSPRIDAPQLDPTRQWFRGLHPAEGGRQPAQALQSPEVIPPYNPTVGLQMTRDIQRLSYDLAAHFHPAIQADREKWRIIHNHSYALNNQPQNGFPAPKDVTPVPHADYVNERDLSASLPIYDKMQRTFSGSLISGQRDANLIWCTPGVDALDARDFVYSSDALAEVLAKHWYSLAVADGRGVPFRMGGHWGEGWIAFLFLLDRPVSFNAAFFAPWRETYPPEPLKVYNRI